MNEFHLLRPWWLLALIPVAATVWLLLRRGRGGGAWQSHVDSALLPYVLTEGAAFQGSRLPAVLAAVTGTLAVLALAGPAWERLPTPVFRNLSALVVVLDLSPAMDAGDLKPSRIERARYKIDDILRARKDGQSALVVYAGDAFTVTPLTDDAGTIQAQLAALSPRLMPVTGSRADLGLERAANLLQQAGLRTGDILLVTAGDGLEGAEAAAARALKTGFRLSVLGVGTPEGAPIPLPQGGFLKDAGGGILVPKLDRNVLRKLAETGGGVYRTLDPGLGDLSTLLRFFEQRAPASGQPGNTVQLDQWREAGIWLLPLLLPLAALGFRRGWLGLWLLLTLTPVPRPAAALDWQDLWQTPDQRAQAALRAGDAAEAARRFRNPAWKAAAEYKAGDFQQAAKDLEGQDSAASHYNRGNALARTGQLEDALRAYDRALQLQPGDADATHNRTLVEEALKKQQEQPRKDQKPEQGQDPKQQEGQPPSEQENGQPKPDPSGQDGQKPGNPGQEERKPDTPEQDGQSKDGQPREAGEPGAEDGAADGRQPGPSAQEPAERQPASGDQTVRPDAAEKPGDPGQPQAVPAEKEATGEKSDAAAEGGMAERSDETRQSEEQWLRRIPDDPGGLLKRKFYYQYRLRQQQEEAERNPWSQ